MGTYLPSLPIELAGTKCGLSRPSKLHRCNRLQRGQNRIGSPMRPGAT
jgi:hypothetical protein